MNYQQPSPPSTKTIQPMLFSCHVLCVYWYDFMTNIKVLKIAKVTRKQVMFNKVHLRREGYVLVLVGTKSFTVQWGEREGGEKTFIFWSRLPLVYNTTYQEENLTILFYVDIFLSLFKAKL